MQALNFKPEFSGSVRQPSETDQSALARHQGRLPSSSDVMVAPLITKPLLLLERFTGAVLGGAATSLLICNILICVSMLLLGPESIIRLLVRINGLNI